jgi:hypothetical protein
MYWAYIKISLPRLNPTLTISFFYEFDSQSNKGNINFEQKKFKRYSNPCIKNHHNIISMNSIFSTSRKI